MKKDGRKITFTCELVVTDEDIEDIVVTALEGGIGYWACLDNRTERFAAAPDDEPVSITTTKILLEGGGVTLIDEEDDMKEYVLTLDKLLSGLEKYLDGSDCKALENGSLDCGYIDSVAADGIVQYAVFGEWIYG